MKFLPLPFTFFFFLLLPTALAAVEINEIMYAPGQCSDSDCEWIELYNSGAEEVNITDCYLDEKRLEGVVSPGEYFVVVRNEEGFKSNFNDLEYILERKITLKNPDSDEEEKLVLNGTEWCDDTVVYTGELANNNNKTLEKNREREWKESLYDDGSPGEKNSNYDFSSDYSHLKITEIMADPDGDDDTLKPQGEWVELYNSGEEPLYLGGLVLYDDDDSHELRLTDSNADTLELCAECYTVVYRDGDSDFDLSKTDDKVRLATGYPLSNYALIDTISFSNAQEGMSFSLFEEGWVQVVPTPGKKNKYTAGCDWEVQIESDNSILEKEDFAFAVRVKRNFGFKDTLTVRGEIQDFFGEAIKEYSPWTNADIATSS